MVAASLTSVGDTESLRAFETSTWEMRDQLQV